MNRISGMEGKRRSTALSCENCRLRKVKCSKPDLDTCQRCRRLGKECFTGDRKARPYYQPSKERYELMVKVIKHFVPSAELDTDSLRQLIRVLEDENRYDQEGQQRSNSATPAANDVAPKPSNSGLDDSTPQTAEVAVSNLSGVLDMDDGAFLGDAMNTYRYLSGSSCAAFHKLTRAVFLSSANYHFTRLQEIIKPEVIMYDGQLVEAPSINDLPSRVDLEKAATRFFTEVNSVIYVMSEELFRYRVDDLYCNQRSCSNSFLAIINLVLAVGDQSERAFKTASSLFEKSLEEGTEESIEVVMLTALYRQNNDQRNLAYIQLGAAVRIAQSLGWHIADRFQNETSPYKIQRKKKLWSSLYELDQLLGCSLGRASTIIDRGGMLLQEMELDTNPQSSSGYCAAVAAFGTILGRICSHIYLRAQPGVIDEAIISSLIEDVHSWWNSLPVYLRTSGLAEPSCFRSICFIGLRYNYALILITRRYLLQAIISGGKCSKEVMSRVKVCEEANDRSADILRNMVSKDMISQLIWFDTLFLFCNVNIIAIRGFLDSNSPQVLQQLTEFLPLVETVRRKCQRGKWKPVALEYVLDFTKALQQDLDNCRLHSTNYHQSQPAAEILDYVDDNLMSFFDSSNIFDGEQVFWNTW